MSIYGECSDERVDVHVGFVSIDECIDREEILFVVHVLSGGHSDPQLPIRLTV